MAHGSKRWITCYDGSTKKSNDRTNKDYFRELKYWDIDPWQVVVNYRQRKPKNNCPQCKFVRKQVLDNQKEHDAARDFVRAEWEKKYGNVEYIKVPSEKWSYSFKHFYTYFREHQKYVPVWQNDWRNYVCFKCEHKLDMKDKIPWKRYRTYKEQANEYRNTVRNVMQRAKYDEDLDEAYEDIPVFKYDAWRD